MPIVDSTGSINGRKSVVKLLSNKLNKQYNYYLLKDKEIGQLMRINLHLNFTIENLLPLDDIAYLREKKVAK